MNEYQYHHIGIPIDRGFSEEDYSKEYKMYASGFAESPYGVEWMKFDADCPLPQLVKTVPHVAFVVNDLEAAIAGKHVLIKPNRPLTGMIVAFIEDHGAPIEFIQFENKEDQVWPNQCVYKAQSQADS